MIEQDNPQSLERAREKISNVARAQSLGTLGYLYGLAVGHIGALLTEQVISTNVYDQLIIEAEQAHAGWVDQAKNKSSV